MFEMPRGRCSMNEKSDKLLMQLANVVEAAITFKDKVERDAPKCFTPSKELANLFETIDEFQEVDNG